VSIKCYALLLLKNFVIKLENLELVSIVQVLENKINKSGKLSAQKLTNNGLESLAKILLFKKNG
jgi:hypothetical protein